MADAHALGACVLIDVRVRIPPSPPYVNVDPGTPKGTVPIRVSPVNQFWSSSEKSVARAVSGLSRDSRPINGFIRNLYPMSNPTHHLSSRI